MNDRRRRELVFSWTGAALVAGILAMVNVLSTFAHVRLDFSSGGMYSISSGTKAILGGLKDNLLIKVYFTRRLPPQYALNGQYLRDLLGEYKSAGRGKVRVEFLDPDDERVKQEAMSAGVSPVRLSVMARDKFEIKEVFMGAALLYGGKSEVIPFAKESADYEYDLTRRIKKLASDSPKTVGLVTGHGEKGTLDPSLQAVFDLVREALNLETVTLDKPLPAKIGALWIIAPQQPFKAGELERLKAWVDSGRSLGLLLDRRDVNTMMFTTRPINPGLDVLLSAWGVSARDGFVADAQSERIQIQQRQAGYMLMNVVEYPLLPVATAINSSHPATRGLDAVVFPFVHPLVVKTEGKPLNYVSLIDSSKDSWYSAGDNISPFAPLQEGEEKGPFSLAGVIEGDFFKVTPSTVAATDGPVPDKPAPGRVILAGTSRLIDPNFAGKSSNISAFLNLLEWSLQDEALLSIRARGMTLRPLRKLGEAAHLLVKLALIFALPMGLLFSGLGVYRWQAARRLRLVQTYGA